MKAEPLLLEFRHLISQNSISRHHNTVTSTSLSKSSRCSIDMPETSIKFGEFSACVVIENKEVQHHAMHVDLAKKEVSCWIASEEGKVRKPLFAIDTRSFE
jgi:hypothetical protein